MEKGVPKPRKKKLKTGDEERPLDMLHFPGATGVLKKKLQKKTQTGELRKK